MSSPASLNLRSTRAREVRLGKAIGKSGYITLLSTAALSILGGIALIVTQNPYGYSLAGLGLLLGMPAIWWRYYLSNTPAQKGDLTARLSHRCLELLEPNVAYSPQSLWRTIQSEWQCIFLTNHLLVPSTYMSDLMSDGSEDLPEVLQRAVQIADEQKSVSVEVNHLAAALLHTSPQIIRLLTTLKLNQTDIDAVSHWSQRILDAAQHKPANFGGIGRDWASGFTPQLNQFGYNVSAAIEQYHAHFGALVEGAGVADMKTAFSKGAGALALVGPDGIGKTTHAYALAQAVLAEAHDPALTHKQIIALDAAAIISAARGPGDLEYILTRLLNEAAHVGNIMLFFDDAQLFFQTGPGSLNATQILLPAMQSRAVQLIFAMTPHDYEQLRANNMAFANILTPVVLKERPEAEVLEVLVEAANLLETRQHVTISYPAIKAAYRLSGRYEVDTAYPGKAIKLLEQSASHVDGNIVTTASVEAAIERTKGVKAGTAAPIEADKLLNLEDAIHERMINQTRAVQVVANALRRARAGVSSPKRPIGSFLFLGPTGVGKTELAKAIAATYFGSETNLVRLDMSEYQQQSDVARILSDGQGETNSLLLNIRQQPFSVVLLDEIEKAHPNILNLLLQLLDEGALTDSKGRSVSFRDCVVIATSNAGADSIRARIEKGEALEAFEASFTDELINSGQFKPELLNRFDEIVLFRPLTPSELAQVVRLMLSDINKTLGTQNVSVDLTDAAIAKIVEAGNDPRLGARPMRRTLQRAVENVVAAKILRGETQPGDQLHLDVNDLDLA